MNRTLLRGILVVFALIALGNVFLYQAVIAKAEEIASLAVMRQPPPLPFATSDPVCNLPEDQIGAWFETDDGFVLHVPEGELTIRLDPEKQTLTTSLQGIAAEFTLPPNSLNKFVRVSNTGGIQTWFCEGKAWWRWVSQSVEQEKQFGGASG